MDRTKAPGRPVEEAIEILRRDPSFQALIVDSYLDRDLEAAATRFALSAEFSEVLGIIQTFVRKGLLLDLGAGRGIASTAFAAQGFSVVALDPELSKEIGALAAKSLVRGGIPVSVVCGSGENLPLADRTFDAVYLRQALHHFKDLQKGLSEISRVLKPHGILIATREHVVDNEAQLRRFRETHPVHRLAGGEGAFSLDEYLDCIGSAGLQKLNVIGPWDSVINAFPAVRDNGELRTYPSKLLRQRLGIVGTLLGRSKTITALAWRRLKRPVPGRMYTFLAQKP